MRRLFALVLIVTLAVASPAVARRRPAPTPSPVPTATPVPTPLPTPTLSPAERLVRLQAQLDSIAHSAPGRLGVCVYDLTHGERIAVRGDEAFPLASVAKLAVGLAAFRRADQGRLNLNDRIVVTAADLRRGTSGIATAHPRGNVTLTIWGLIAATLIDDDSTANDLLLQLLGGPEAIDRFLTNLGAHGFRYRKSEAERYADARAHRSFARGGDNAGSPCGVSDLLSEIAQGHELGLDSTNELLLLLTSSRAGSGRLRAGLPPDAALAHVSGGNDAADGSADTTNDAGILTLPDGRRIVIVALLAGARGDVGTRDAVIAQVARAAYEAFGP